MNRKKESLNKRLNNNYQDNNVIWKIFLFITCIKVLLIPTYHSTDFEVHRNWLAITYSLPVKQWYINEESQWTLDYPPFFAWFEYGLSQIAALFDKEMLDVKNFNYASSSTVLFQRTSVMFADLLFAFGVKELGKQFATNYESFFIHAFLTLCNIGLLIIDHVHFQYNGFLLGMLLLAIAKVSKINRETTVLQGALFFAVLLNFKHIYLYVAPAFIIWLLKSYCLNGNFVKRLFLLIIIVAGTLTVSFGPFIHQIPQVISRLFPFKRGLVHAYWAANVWSLYISVDKLFSILWKQFGWIGSARSAVMTGGLVQEQSFVVLPNPTAFDTFFLTFLSMIPALAALFFKENFAKDSKQFVRCVVLCALSSFMFGWHVHEKAILTAIIPLCILAVNSKEDARIFLILSSAGHTALLPLLYKADLTPLKFLLLLIYTLASIVLLEQYFKQCLLRRLEYIYVISLPLLTIYETIVHRFIFDEQLPFLPLAVTSIYCALGISYSFLLYYKFFFYNDNNVKVKGNVRLKYNRGKGFCMNLLE